MEQEQNQEQNQPTIMDIDVPATTLNLCERIQSLGKLTSQMQKSLPIIGQLEIRIEALEDLIRGCTYNGTDENENALFSDIKDRKANGD